MRESRLVGCGVNLHTHIVWRIMILAPKVKPPVPLRQPTEGRLPLRRDCALGASRLGRRLDSRPVSHTVSLDSLEKTIGEDRWIISVYIF